MDELCYIDYLSYRLDAFVSLMSKSEWGREYLRNARRLTVTTPNREELKKRFG